MQWWFIGFYLWVFVCMCDVFWHYSYFVSGDCEPWNNTPNAVPVEKQPVDTRIRIQCEKGYVRKAGTSNLLICKENNGNISWDNKPPLECIRKILAFCWEMSRAHDMSAPLNHDHNINKMMEQMNKPRIRWIPSNIFCLRCFGKLIIKATEYNFRVCAHHTLCNFLQNLSTLPAQYLQTDSDFWQQVLSPLDWNLEKNSAKVQCIPTSKCGWNTFDWSSVGWLLFKNICFGLCDTARCQFTQQYFDTLECQLGGNTRILQPWNPANKLGQRSQILPDLKSLHTHIEIFMNRSIIKRDINSS